MVIFMWAQAQNFVIGKDNTMPWNNKEEMSFFARTTKDKNIAMGRVTYDAIRKPLKNKRSVNILSKTQFSGDYEELYFDDVEKLVKYYDNINEDLYIIGGYEVFKHSKQFVDKLHVSVLDHAYDGDLYMDKFEIGADNINLFDHDFEIVDVEEHDSFIFYDYKRV